VPLSPKSIAIPIPIHRHPQSPIKYCIALTHTINRRFYLCSRANLLLPSNLHLSLFIRLLLYNLLRYLFHHSLVNSFQHIARRSDDLAQHRAHFSQSVNRSRLLGLSFRYLEYLRIGLTIKPHHQSSRQLYQVFLTTSHPLYSQPLAFPTRLAPSLAVDTHL
jgi:hypothetical protein